MRKLLPGICIFLATILFLFFLSCNNNSSKKDKEGSDTSMAEKMSADAPNETVTCITLTRDQIKAAWVDSGWTAPGDPELIVWMRYLTTYGGPGTDFDVTLWGAEADTVNVPHSSVAMQDGSGCSVTMPAGINYGPNYFRLSQLDILNPDGSLKTFDYIRLTPQVSENPEYANFKVEVVTRAGAQVKGNTNPCPPLCPF